MLAANLAGLLLIGFIIWWFWLYSATPATAIDDSNVINVENGNYSPARITIPAGQARSITFLRRDPSACAETVVIPDLQLSDTLPFNQPKTLLLPAMVAGEYDFHCQMKMYRGKIIVV